MKHNEFQEQVENKLVKFKEETQFLPGNNEKKKWQYFDISDNLFPPIKHSFLQFAYDNAVPLHDYVNHVRSSQIFGINILFPLLTDPKKKGQKVLIDLLNQKLKRNIDLIESYQYEYSPDEDWLGEWPGTRKPSEYLTSSDIFIICRESNKRIAILIEVKFTENEFGPCNGITSNGCSENDRKNCEDFVVVQENIQNCYLHKSYKTRSARRYFEYFNLKDEIIMYEKECPFIHNNQCIRNHALARALVKYGEFDDSYFGLVVYDNNIEINNYWKDYIRIMNNSKELFKIDASEIVKNYGSCDKTYKLYFDKRYGT